MSADVSQELQWHDHYSIVVTVGRYLVGKDWTARELQWYYETPSRYQEEYDNYCRSVAVDDDSRATSKGCAWPSSGLIRHRAVDDDRRATSKGAKK